MNPIILLAAASTGIMAGISITICLLQLKSLARNTKALIQKDDCTNWKDVVEESAFTIILLTLTALTCVASAIPIAALFH